MLIFIKSPSILMLIIVIICFEYWVYFLKPWANLFLEWTLLLFHKYSLVIIVFRPGLVQGSGSGFWSGLPGQCFFKN
jgi:hypothetical protein